VSVILVISSVRMGLRNRISGSSEGGVVVVVVVVVGDRGGDEVLGCGSVIVSAGGVALSVTGVVGDSACFGIAVSDILGLVICRA
jgi:hypothetical protein